MDVRRVLNQSDRTLREFYGERAADPETRSDEIGRRMLALLDQLAATDGPPLLGLTSHLVLHLFPESGSPPVGIAVHGHGPGYVVEPSSSNWVTDWPGGWAPDPAGAVALVLAGLRAEWKPAAV
jgi:hypothetical protein